MKVAITHDYLNQYGGAERVLEVMHEIWPDAPVFTIVYNQKKLPEYFKKWNIITTFVQRFPFIKTQYEKYFAIFPVAVEQIDLQGFDIVISISSAWAKGVITTPDVLHISYLLNPMRFAWNEYYSRIRRTRRIIFRMGIRFLLNYIRLWDVISTQRVDHIIAISETIRRRISKYYGRDSEIIYPPCDTDFFVPNPNLKIQDYFLIVSRLKDYKRIDIVVQAFNQIDLPLLIIGEGEARGKLEKHIRPNVQFLGALSDEEIRSYYQRAQALILPGMEDFGIVPVEAQACGTPVIAFKKGGAVETVVEGKTGLFFSSQTKEAVIEVIKKFDRKQFKSDVLRKQALKFSKNNFKQQLKDFVLQKYKSHISV